MAFVSCACEEIGSDDGHSSAARLVHPPLASGMTPSFLLLAPSHSAPLRTHTMGMSKPRRYAHLRQQPFPLSRPTTPVVLQPLSPDARTLHRLCPPSHETYALRDLCRSPPSAATEDSVHYARGSSGHPDSKHAWCIFFAQHDQRWRWPHHASVPQPEVWLAPAVDLSRLA